MEVKIAQQLKSSKVLEYGFIPTTYILPKDRKLLKDNFGHETFIVKPAASARGIGIKVTSSFSIFYKVILDCFKNGISPSATSNNRAKIYKEPALDKWTKMGLANLCLRLQLLPSHSIHIRRRISAFCHRSIHYEF